MTDSPPPPVEEAKRTLRPPRIRRRETRRGHQCLNCATDTTTRYCPECGQENVDVNISLFEIFREAAEEFFRIDSKLARTLTPLLTKPGKLTREWRAGRRASYISPLKLYLTVTFVFFLIVPSLTSLGNIKTTTQKNVPVMTQPEDLQGSIDKLPWWMQYPMRQIIKLNVMTRGTAAEQEQQQAAFKQHFLDQIPTALFIMLPVFAGVLWILYIRNRRYYVEHLVFALHCHAFYFVLLMVVVALSTGLNFWIASLIRLLALWMIAGYSLVALKVNYDQDWPKTILKAGMLAFAYMVLFSFTLLGCVIVAASALPELPKATVKGSVKVNPFPTQPKTKDGPTQDAK